MTHVTKTFAASAASGVDRRRRVEAAQERWAEELLDPARAGSLIAPLGRAAVELHGVPVDEIDAAPSGGCSVAGLLKGVPGVDWQDVRAVHREGAMDFDAHGVHTVHLVRGMATWDGRVPSPVPALIRPVRLRPAPGHRDVLIASVGPWELNPGLISALRREYSLSVDPSSLAAWLGGAVHSVRRAGEACVWVTARAAGVPGFAIDDRTVLTTLSPAPISAAERVIADTELLAASDLAAAAAGDAAAGAALAASSSEAEVPLDAPDRANPAEEHLILDADASQHRVVGLAAAGRSLLVTGAPGTGKSQTAANLVASALARGERVVLVARSRAAVETVVRRLARAGLGDLVGGPVAGAAAGVGRPPEPTAAADRTASHRELVEARRRARDAVRAPHEKHSPWGMSLYEIQNALLALPANAAVEARLSGARLAAVPQEAVDGLADDLSHCLELRAARPDAASPWGRAVVRDAATARELVGLVDALREGLPRARAGMAEACVGCEVAEPADVAGWSRLIEFWETLESSAEQMSPGIYEEDVDGLRRDLMRAPQSGVGRAVAGMFSGVYKSARGRVRELVGDGTDAELLDRLGVVARNIERWRGLGGTARPALPEDLAGLRREVSTVSGGLDRLGGALGRGDLAELGLPDLERLLDDLHEDRARLTERPELERIEGSLRSSGLADLLQAVAPAAGDPERIRAMVGYSWLSSVRDAILFSDRQRGGALGGPAGRHAAVFRERDRRHLATAAERVLRHRGERTDASAVGVVKGNGWPDGEDRTAVWATTALRLGELPRDLRADLVVVDEADVLTPAEAAAALARGRRAVLFADALSSDEAPPGAAPRTLAEALGPHLGRAALDTHYRSLDEALFAFSNARFYDDDVHTFPAAAPAEAVRLVPAAAGHLETAVAEVVAALAEEHPDATIGVLALDAGRVGALDAAVRRLLFERADLRPRFSGDGLSDLAVRPAADAHGAEWDAAVVVAGREPGALAGDDGERVLNRALTRARRTLVVVTEGDPPSGEAPGAVALRDFLASPGGEAGPGGPRGAPDDAFADDVLRALSARGLDVTPRVGTTARPVEFGVSPPGSAGDYVLAVETDGPAALAIPTTRDRDRIRPEQLERRGWAHMRIGSAEWFDDAETVARRVEERLGEVVEAAARAVEPGPEADAGGGREPGPAPEHRADAPSAGAEGEDHPVDPGQDVGGRGRSGSCPAPPGLKITRYTDAQLDGVVRWIASDGVERNEDQLLGEVMDALGFRRRGSRIVASIEKAIARVRDGAST